MRRDGHVSRGDAKISTARCKGQLHSITKAYGKDENHDEWQSYSWEQCNMPAFAAFVLHRSGSSTMLIPESGA